MKRERISAVSFARTNSHAAIYYSVMSAYITRVHRGCTAKRHVRPWYRRHLQMAEPFPPVPYTLCHLTIISTHTQLIKDRFRPLFPFLTKHSKPISCQVGGIKQKSLRCRQDRANNTCPQRWLPVKVLTLTASPNKVTRLALPPRLARFLQARRRRRVSLQTSSMISSVFRQTAHWFLPPINHIKTK